MPGKECVSNDQNPTLRYLNLETQGPFGGARAGVSTILAYVIKAVVAVTSKAIEQCQSVLNPSYAI